MRAATATSRPRRRSVVAVAALATVALGACGSAATTSSPPSSSVGSSVPMTTATGTTGSTDASEPGASEPGDAGGARTGMRGDRYCEVLLLDVVDGQASAEVYVSYPLNDCPEGRWSTLDPVAIAADQGSTLAVLNGPRHWLMDRIEKEATDGPGVVEDFGGIEMQRQASVQVGALADASVPYRVREVNRSTRFTFDAGSTVYELRAPDGATFVMQSWSQQKDPTLTEADLAGLGSRLQLPEGWTYAARVLAEPLVVDTTASPARVLQDELANSYSFTG